MTKRNNNWTGLLYGVLGFVAGLLLGFLVWGLAKPAGAGDTDHAWSSPVYGVCTPKNDCGPEGTQTVTTTCIYQNGADEDCDTHNYEYANKTWVNDHKVCPAGYSDQGHNGSWPKDCRKDNGPDTQVTSQDCTLAEFNACTVYCEDEAALNYKEEGVCEYPPTILCNDPNALNNGDASAICRYAGPGSAPQPPSCEAPTWAPSVTYLGQVGNTFKYAWSTVKDGLHTYWVKYGPTPDNLPYEVVVTGESVDLTMFNANSNWMTVAGYDNGCLGPFSEVTN